MDANPSRADSADANSGNPNSGNPDLGNTAESDASARGGSAPESAQRPLGGRRAPRSVAFALVLLLVGGAIFALVEYGGGVSEFVKYDREETTRVVHGELCRGWQYLPRQGEELVDPVRVRVFSPSTGFLVYESESLSVDFVRTTLWTPDGKVMQQTEFRFGGPSFSRTEPPWEWGVEDQTEPTAPPEWREPATP